MNYKIKLKISLKTTNIFETILILYFTIGQLTLKVNYIDSFLLVVINMLVLIICIINKEKIYMQKDFLLKFLINIFFCIIIFLSMINNSSNFNIAFNRFLVIFGIFSIFSLYMIVNDIINYDKIFILVFKFYYILGIIIIGDAFFFYLTNKCLWVPIYYLGYRFKGPFYDPNFMALVYGSLLLLLLNMPLMKVYRNKYTIIYFIVLILSYSWTGIGILFLTIILRFFIKFRNIFLKQILFLILYVIALFLALKSLDTLVFWFNKIFSYRFNMGENALTIKFNSLKYRFLVQEKAISSIIYNIFGLGPKTIVDLLGRDTHNSYLGMTFEMGIPALLLIFNSLNIKLKHYYKYIDLFSSYIFFMAMTLNVHYEPIYGLLIFLLVRCYKYENNT